MKRKKKLGQTMFKLEDLMERMIDKHDLQWGEVMNLVYGYLVVHYPGAQEEYENGENPVFYYGPSERLKKVRKAKRRKKSE